MREYIPLAAQLVQVLAVVVGVVISVRTFVAAQEREAQSRRADASKQAFEMLKYREGREAEASRPYAELRQRLYLDAIHSAAILSNPNVHTEAELKEAKKRFWELYWGELSLAEDRGVECHMKKLGDELEPNQKPTAAQLATYELAHQLRDSLKRTWRINEGGGADTNTTK